MSSTNRNENLVTKEVTYTLFKDGQYYIVENVPAAVDVETGDQFFSPQTVENLHQIILGQKKACAYHSNPGFQFHVNFLRQTHSIQDPSEAKKLKSLSESELAENRLQPALSSR